VRRAAAVAPVAVAQPAAVAMVNALPGATPFDISGVVPPQAPVAAYPAPDREEPDGVDQDQADEAGGSLASVAKAAAMKAERVVIEKTLRQVHWNRRKAAQILGVSYKTLLNKIKECGISRD
jgi:DNA-binding NtrC family response regulator